MTLSNRCRRFESEVFVNCGEARLVIVHLSSTMNKSFSGRPGQGAFTSALPLSFLLSGELQKAGRDAASLFDFVSRLNRSAQGTQKSIAARLILRFCCRMIRASIPGSKLCACSTRHARQRAYMPSVVAQLAKGEIPRLNPPVRRYAACGTRPRFHASEVRL
jgi:hypothetical protein